MPALQTYGRQDACTHEMKLLCHGPIHDKNHNHCYMDSY